MNYVVIVSLSLSLLAGATSASAATLLYEPFNYDAGTTLNGVGPDPVNKPAQTWAEVNTNATTGNDLPTITAGSLPAPTGLPAPQGNSSVHGGSGHTSRLALGTSITSGRIYYSALVRVDTTTTTANGQIMAFNNGTGTQTGNVTQMLADLWVKRGSGSLKFVLGIGKNAATNPLPVYMSGEMDTGTTVQVVAAYDFGPNDPSDSLPDNTDGYAMLWINPDPSTLGTANEPAPTLISAPDPTGVTTVAITDISSIVSVALYQYGNSSGTGNSTVDEIRVANNWQEVTGGVVVPEPSSLAVLISAAGLLRRRRMS